MRSLARVSMIALFAGCATIPSTTHTVAQSVDDSIRLVGVWKPVEIFIASNATAHAGDKAGPAGPGLWFFAAHHYAVLDVHTTESRPPLPPSEPTAAQLMATWGPFGANAGTYQVEGGTITMQPTVAKNPQLMTPGRKVTLSYRVEGDTLWLWGLSGRPTEMVKHVRVD